MDDGRQMYVAPADPAALRVAYAAFLGMQKGAATGDWTSFTDLLLEDARVMIPVPPEAVETPEGLIVGRTHIAAELGRHHGAMVSAVRLSCARVAANGAVVMMEARVEGSLGGEAAANHYVFTFEVRDGGVASMYHYAIWTAKRPGSRWDDLGFAREAFDRTLIPVDESWFEDHRRGETM